MSHASTHPVVHLPAHPAEGLRPAFLRAAEDLRRLAGRISSLDRRAAATARHVHDHVYLSLRARLREALGAGLSEARVLDFGCGDDHGLTDLLASDVREVVGVDVVPPVEEGALRRLDVSGEWRSPRALVRGLVEYAEASRRSALSRDHLPPARAPRVARYDGGTLPFEDGSFDAVVSNAVLQELPLPLGRFASEMRRVLRPGGVVDLEWHSFTSLHGHYLGDEASFASPWFHLFDEGSACPRLNRVRPEAVRWAFEPYFAEVEVLGHDRAHRIRGRDPGFEPEGEELLGPALLADLEALGNTREALTTRGYVLRGVAR